MLAANDFRRIALRMRDAVEAAHMGHPDFRVGGRIFATLQANDEWGVVMLTPEQQQHFVRNYPDVFVAAAGAWGLQGSTTVRLGAADEEVVGEALTLAWQNRATQRTATSRTSRPRTQRRGPAVRKSRRRK
jgi:hypothetical protein